MPRSPGVNGSRDRNKGASYNVLKGEKGEREQRTEEPLFSADVGTYITSWKTTWTILEVGRDVR